MPKTTVNGMEIDFPFSPYPLQHDYMQKVIEAMSSGENAILESPTGTGKTLCLLCSTLAWQKANKSPDKTKDKPVLMIHDGPNITITNVSLNKSSNIKTQAGVIIYASRTHSQLTQVVKELRSTGYRPTMTVLGSREQLCVNPKLANKRGSTLNYECNKLSASRSCRFKTNLDDYSRNDNHQPVIDIEDIVKLSKTDGVCGYFFSRGMIEKSELILLPYNYLLDSNIRSTLKIDWNNSIVIFDEAHNLEKVASDAASFKLTSTELAECINELQKVLTALKEDNLIQSISQKMDKDSGDKDRTPKPKLENVIGVLKSLFDLEKRLDSLPLEKTEMSKNKCMVQPGPWLLQILEAVGLSQNVKDFIMYVKYYYC